MRGGKLSFEGYFLWAPKIVPKDHTGLLVRINEASGTGFDDSFAAYQVAEYTRKNQISAEVFIDEGLEVALNIDRESFNYAHPHYQFLTKWVHSALRQLANAQKSEAKQAREKKSAEEKDEHRERMQAAAADVVKRFPTYSSTGKDGEEPPVYTVAENSEKAATMREQGQFVLDLQQIVGLRPGWKKQELFVELIRGIAAVLQDFGIFDELSYERQHEVLSAIAAMVEEYEKKT